MTVVIDSDLPPTYRTKWLEAVETYLPAFLHRGTEEHRDLLGDVQRLLNLREQDLSSVMAVHQCLDARIQGFGKSLRQGLREPMVSSSRPPSVSQAVRGAVDWGATTKLRSQRGGDPSSFVVRTADRIFDIPENRAVSWLLQTIAASAEKAGYSLEDETDEGEALTWFERIGALRIRIGKARSVHWIARIPAEKPTGLTMRRLKNARKAFYANDVYEALKCVLEMEDPDEDMLTAVLCQRQFRPKKTSLLFEVYVALMLVDAFSKISPRPRKTRLLVGSGRQPFARFGLSNGEEICLYFQGWPGSLGTSVRRATAERHRLAQVSSTQQDLFIELRSPKPGREVIDCAVLELKASNRSSTLIDGLSQLLGYLGEFPELDSNRPSAWLVAPKSDAFEDKAPDSNSSLWITSAEVAVSSAVERFARVGQSQ